MNAMISRLTACGQLALCLVIFLFAAVSLTACPPPDDCLRIANPLVGAQQVESPFWLRDNGGEVYRLRDGHYIVVPPGQTLEDTLKTMEECEPVTIVFSTETPTEMTSTPPVTITTPTATPTPTETATTTVAQTTPTPLPVTPTVEPTATPAEITPTWTPTITVDPVTFTPTPVPAESPTQTLTPNPATLTPVPSIDHDGDGYTVSAGDCDDFDASINPAADEFCDGTDSDCNGEIDDDPIEGGVPLYFDYDYDGVGGDQIINDNVCYFELPGPIWFAFVTGDCDDEDPDVYPGAPELCDGEDNDCDDAIDEDITVDNDFDGYTECSGDCDDTADHTYPAADELQDGVDNNCNGQIDEGGETPTPTPEVTQIPGTPSNDLCVNAIPVEVGHTYTGSTETATSDGIGACDGSSAAKSVWYAFRAPYDGEFIFSTCGSGFDTILTLLSSCGGSIITCNDDGPNCDTNAVVYRTMRAGEVTWMQVSGYARDSFGNFQLTVSDEDPDDTPTPAPTPETCDFENFESYVEGPATTTDYSGFSVTLLAGQSLNYVDFNEDMALCAADNGTDSTQLAFNLDVPTDFLGVLPYSLSYQGLFCGYYAGELIQCLTVYPIADEQYIGLVFTRPVDKVVFDATVTDSICVGLVNTCR